jgi:sialate O-acetylesterase
MNIADSGPTPVAAVRNGNMVAVSFDHVVAGLAVYEYHRPVGFQVCDAAKRCSFVDGIRNLNEIDLDVAQFPDATTVRYCWADSPICNVYNSENLPAAPFEIQIVQAPKIGKQLVRKPRHHRLRSGRTGM